MTKDEVLKLALKALENSVDLVCEDAYKAEKLYGNYPSRQGKVAGLKVLADDHEKAITAIKQALAAPVQKPVAWVDYETGNQTKRPQNCGTGYCSCIECVMEPAPVQEPVVWMNKHGACKISLLRDVEAGAKEEYTIPLYTTPPQRTWVGLTAEDLKILSAEWRIVYGAWMDDFAKDIEAKLKEKNT
jgi:hypothetical protein